MGNSDKLAGDRDSRSMSAAGHWRRMRAGKLVQFRKLAAGQRVRFGHVLQVLAQILLQEPAEVHGPSKDAIGGIHGKHAVRVDQLETNRDVTGRCAIHRREKKAREVVAHDDGRAAGQRCQQAFGGSWVWLHVGIVEDSLAGKRPRIVDHSLDDEEVHAVARPAVVATQCLQDHQRLGQFLSPFGGPLQTEIERGTTIGRHPVKHILAVGILCSVTDAANSNSRYLLHALSAFPRVGPSTTTKDRSPRNVGRRRKDCRNNRIRTQGWLGSSHRHAFRLQSPCGKLRGYSMPS